MKLLVTGGAGFIGGTFVRRVNQLRPEWEIVVLDTMSYAASLDNFSRDADSVSFVEGDIRDSSLVVRLVETCDVVLNFAAETHNDTSLRDPRIFFETNVMGTLNLAEACVRFAKRLHHVSTDEVFGDLPIETTEVFNLDSPYNPSSPYSASKASSDHIIRAWIRSFGLKATISNCSNNYGVRQHVEKLIPATIFRLYSGERASLYGSGLNVRDWIHVQDHVDGILRVIEAGVEGKTYLFGSRDQQSNLAIVTKITEIMGAPRSDIEFVQDRPGHDRRYAIDPSYAENELGWLPRHGSVLEELPPIVEWYLDFFRKNSQVVA